MNDKAMSSIVSGYLNATAILSQRETWVRAVSVVAWRYVVEFIEV